MVILEKPLRAERERRGKRDNAGAFFLKNIFFKSNPILIYYHIFVNPPGSRQALSNKKPGYEVSGLCTEVRGDEITVDEWRESRP